MELLPSPRRRGAPKALAALALAVALALGGCGSARHRVEDEQRHWNHRTINLFGLAATERHHIEHRLREASGRIFLVAEDPEEGTLEWVYCPVQVQYVFHPADAETVQELVIANKQRLHAELPLSAVSFESIIESGSELEFKYVTAGSYEPVAFQLPVSDPECSKATHYVQTLSVGAFRWSEVERRGAAAGARVDAPVGGGPGAGAGASHLDRARTNVGDFAACRDAERGGCRTPLQVMLAPLTSHHWCPEGDAQCEARVTRCHGPKCGSTAHPTERTVPTFEDERTPADAVAAERRAAPPPLPPEPGLLEGAWVPGAYMAQALDRVLEAAGELEAQSAYGFDDTGACLLGGFLMSRQELTVGYGFEPGEEYALFAVGSDGVIDLDIKVENAAGEVIAQDVKRDAFPAVRLTPTDAAEVNVRLIMAAAEPTGAFATMVVFRRGGFHVPMGLLRESVLAALGGGSRAAERLDGVAFHEGDWALYGTILKPGYGMTQRRIGLTDSPTIFLAAGDSGTQDLDIRVEAADQQWSDSLDDAVPVVIVERPAQRAVDLRVSSHGEGERLSFVTALVLEAGGGAPAAPTAAPSIPDGAFPDRCDGQERYGGIEPGARVTLGRHGPVAGDANWSPEMEGYVGSVATVTRLSGTDEAGCTGVRVDLDGAQFFWRVRDLEPAGGAYFGVPETIYRAGGWNVIQLDENVVVWRDKGRVAAEFWGRSNGWWRWRADGVERVVWSDGSRSDQEFDRRPWEGSFPGGAEAPAGSAFSHGMTRVAVTPRGLEVTLSDDGRVLFPSGGGPVVFVNYVGEQLVLGR